MTNKIEIVMRMKNGEFVAALWEGNSDLTIETLKKAKLYNPLMKFTLVD